MGFLSRRRSSEPDLVKAQALLFDEADCTELVPAVGESHYQDALIELCGSKRWEKVAFDCVAVLVPEPSNRYDASAISVQIEGRLIGYLSRSDARAYRRVVDDA